VIADLRELRSRDGRSMLERVREQVRRDQEQGFEELAQAIEHGDWKRVGRSAHGVAGQAAIVGARAVADAARALQTRADGGDLSREEAQRALTSLQHAWRAAEAELANLAG
jgi:HPt (histidine-containing phosphotransfer) domain-containing protein